MILGFLVNIRKQCYNFYLELVSNGCESSETPDIWTALLKNKRKIGMIVYKPILWLASFKNIGPPTPFTTQRMC
jgi:hypothetical protein